MLELDIQWGHGGGGDNVVAPPFCPLILCISSIENWQGVGQTWVKLTKLNNVTLRIGI